MKPKILVTRRVFPEIVASLSGQFEVDHNESDDILTAVALHARAQGCEGIVACLTEKIDVAFFDAHGGKGSSVAGSSARARASMMWVRVLISGCSPVRGTARLPLR